jgi:hypothetical protein
MQISSSSTQNTYLSKKDLENAIEIMTKDLGYLKGECFFHLYSWTLTRQRNLTEQLALMEEYEGNSGKLVLF